MILQCEDDIDFSSISPLIYYERELSSDILVNGEVTDETSCINNLSRLFPHSIVNHIARMIHRKPEGFTVYIHDKKDSLSKTLRGRWGKDEPKRVVAWNDADAQEV